MNHGKTLAIRERNDERRLPAGRALVASRFEWDSIAKKLESPALLQEHAEL